MVSPAAMRMRPVFGSVPPRANLPLVPAGAANSCSGGHRIDLPPLVAAKVALYKIMREAPTTHAALAKRLGIALTTAPHLTDLDHRTPIALVDRALGVLGKRVVAEIHDAA